MTYRLDEFNPALRREGVLSLRAVKSDDAFPLLMRVLENDPSPVVRHEAAFILGTLKEERSIPILINAAYNDTSDLVRHEAIEALGDMGTSSPEVLETLRELMDDPIDFIQDTAEIAMATLMKEAQS